MTERNQERPGDPPAGDRSRDFIREIVDADLASGKHARVATRFPPEPNGYLHIGHAKSICLNFGIAREVGGTCNLRYDDTNPSKEDVEYVDAIEADVRWLGFDWADRKYYASDYFEKLYLFAEELIQQGLAYVDDQSAEEIRANRGTLTQPGKESPFRGRAPEENLDLFRRMRAGEFPDGARVLRARIDMASPNMVMRDPTLYRIRRAHHHRTGDAWCIYPMYDFTHCISDALEGITHSICTLEFEINRPLYDWVLEHVSVPCHPRQIEFARLNLAYTVMSKRKLLQLVQDGHVRGWDDPRMPTLAGLRRRGVTPEALRLFCDRIGVAKRDSTVEIELFEHCLREDLNLRARRVMAVLRPLKVVIDNYPEGKVEELDAAYFPDDPPKMGYRKVPFSRELFIERDDFMEEPPRKFFRLAPGREVRLRWAYLLRCERVVKDPATGEIVELGCTIDPETLNANPADGRKVKGTIHWVSAAQALAAEVRLVDRLFRVERPGEERDFLADLNPDSMPVVERALVEPSLKEAPVGDRVQFERTGFFSLDPDSRPGRPVFNRIVSLKDSWAKIAKAEGVK
jgi:glutaminyl-tRNA synthetase